jgi:serine/threonine protein kinase
MSDLAGTHLGHYRLIRLLGKGGMAEVYLAYDEEQQREVAIKMISGHNVDYLERFMREVAAVDKLTHKHILPAYDYDSEGLWHYLVMPYMPAGTLRDLLEEGPLSPAAALELLEQIADALQFAHEQGIIHRDIKPSNILLRDANYAYLADFGVARFVENSNRLTQTGALLGTPEYMAPDLAEGPATSSTDIYALGIVLYQMLTGQLPFVAETPLAVYWKQIRDQPPPPSQHQPGLSPAIDAVILRALEKDPRWRFHSARELAEAFRQAIQKPERYLAQERQRVRSRLRQERKEAARLSATGTRRPLRLRRSTSPSDPSFLPEAAPVAVKTRERRPVAITLPPLPLRRRATRRNDLETPYPAQPLSQQIVREQPRIRRRRNTMVVSIVTLGLLLFVGLPMSYMYYVFETHRSQATVLPVATPSAQTTQQAPQGQSQTPTLAGTAPTITGSVPLLDDPLNTNTPGRWAEDVNHCVFAGGSYHVNVLQTNFLQTCPLLAPTIDNAAIQVEVSLRSGSNTGVMLRTQGESFYDFEINNQRQFFLRRHDPGKGSSYTNLIPPTTSSAILPGGLPNTLLVIANGANFKLYINGTAVGEATDSTYASGQIALATGTLAPLHGGEGSFSHFKLFKVS